MKKLMKNVLSENSNEIYSVILTLSDDNELFDWSCTCKFMSFFYWTKENLNNQKTLCKHILKVISEEGLELPKEWQTERNLKVLNEYKK